MYNNKIITKMRYTKKNIYQPTLIDTSNVLIEGESMEEKLRRLTITKEPIEVDMQPEIYQERKSGVDPFCDIRTDRFEMAQQASDTMSRTYALARKNRDNFGKDENGDPKKHTWVTDTDGNIVEIND